MKIIKNSNDINLVLNVETDFLTNLGSEENLQQFEGEVLDEILNPIENYEIIRFIHEPYLVGTGTTLNQCDIWFYFYFLNNGSYVQDYAPQGISSKENELMLKQSTESFFRLEFYKTPGTVTNNVLTCEPPTRVNRKLIFSRNLTLPLGEKMFFNTLNGYVHLPVFNGNNYRNKENMYLFWFEEENVFDETNLSGTTTGNTFFMTAKFYNAKNGSIVDFTNSGYTQNHEVEEEKDMYYQVDINRTNHTYKIHNYIGGSKGDRVGTVSGTTINAVKFYEKGGGTTTISQTTLTPTPTQTPTKTPTPTPTSQTSQTSIFTATVDKSQYGEQPPNNVVKVTVNTSQSMVGTYIWWGKKSGTATTNDFINYNTAMLIQSSTGYTFDLVITDDETTEGDQTFAVAIYTGTSSNAGGEVAYTSTFTILDDSIAPQYRYVILERIKDYNGGPCDVAGNNLTNFYWDQVNDGILDGSDQLWSGAGYCYRVVSFTNDTNELGNTQISDASKNNCPSCPS
jgi:hypothetical protein